MNPTVGIEQLVAAGILFLLAIIMASGGVRVSRSARPGGRCREAWDRMADDDLDGDECTSAIVVCFTFVLAALFVGTWLAVQGLGHLR